MTQNRRGVNEKGMKQLLVRQEAADRGERHYDGNPCRNCAATKRYVLTGRCVACMIRKATDYYERTRGELAARRDRALAGEE